MTPIEFLEKRMAFHALRPYSVHSEVRTIKRNYEVGGDETSWHLVFLAIDGVWDDPIDEEEKHRLTRWCVRMGLDLDVKPSMQYFHMEPNI